MALKIMTMKRLTNIFIGLAALVTAAASCQKEETAAKQEIDQDLAAEWELIETKAEGTVVAADMSVYLCINTDGTFELFQKSAGQTVRYDRFTGKCWSADGIVNGTYSDGTGWASKWMYSFTADGMTLQSYNLLEVQKYKKTTIPAEVRNNANDITKSEAASGSPIL